MGTIVDARLYEFRPGDVPRFLKHAEQNGIPVITRYVELHGHWYAEAGDLNHVLHLWTYDGGLGERAERRTALMRDAAWTDGFLREALPMMVNQRNWILEPVAATPGWARRAEVPRLFAFTWSHPSGDGAAPDLVAAAGALAGDAALWRCVTGAAGGVLLGRAFATPHAATPSALAAFPVPLPNAVTQLFWGSPFSPIR